MKIRQGLRDFTVLLDFESGAEGIRKSALLARERLAPLLDCLNGTLAPEFHVVGHSHLDLAWMWPLAETKRKAVRTLSTQLSLMEEYPEYRYLQSQPFIYQIIKEQDKDLYERIRRRVREGRIIAEGGMWVEADVNLVSGESLIRQISCGKSFFREEFGVESMIL